MSRKRDSHRGARVGDGLEDRLSEFADDYGYNDAEANRRAWDEGLRALGYYPDHTTPETKLRHVLRNVSTILGFSGLLLIGLTLFTSAELRLTGFLLVISALAVRGVEQGIARIEPRLTRRLTRSEGGPQRGEKA